MEKDERATTEGKRLNVSFRTPQHCQRNHFEQCLKFSLSTFRHTYRHIYQGIRNRRTMLNDKKSVGRHFLKKI